MDITPTVQLTALTDLPDYRITSHDTDPRGWETVDANKTPVGTITDLIIDVDGHVARYMVCALTDKSERRVLLPVGFARFDNEHRIVFLDFVTMEVVANLPTFTGLPLSAQQTAQTEKALTGIAPAPMHEAKIIRRMDETRDAS